jgi:hypothetical protein
MSAHSLAVAHCSRLAVVVADLAHHRELADQASVELVELELATLRQQTRVAVVAVQEARLQLQAVLADRASFM